VSESGDSGKSSLQVILAQAEWMHSRLLENSRALDTKGSILLALLGLLLVKTLDDMELVRTTENYLLSVALGTSFLAMLLCFWAIRLHGFIHFRLGVLQERYDKGESADRIMAQLFANFREAAEDSLRIVKRKAQLLALAYWLTLIAILAFVFSELWRRFIHG